MGVWQISSGIGPCFPLAGGLCKVLRLGMLRLGSGSQVLFPLCAKANVSSNCRKVYPPPLLVWPNSWRRVPASPGPAARGCVQSADSVRCWSRHFEFDAAPARIHGKSAAVSSENILVIICQHFWIFFLFKCWFHLTSLRLVILPGLSTTIF
jgi:hypothetical protein